MARNPSTAFSILAPPYRELLPLDPEESFPSDSRVLQGTALVWRLGPEYGDSLLDRVAERPPGLPLMVVLPPAKQLYRIRDRVLEVAEDARPQSVLPFHPRLIAEEMAALLRREPTSIPDDLVDFLQWRGLGLDRETRRIIKRTAELSSELRTLKALARGLYLSRRALGRRFQKRGLPVPSHWLQFCRLLRATVRLQNSRHSLFDVARSLGYPDGFTLSNQMARLVGVRPSVARKRLGWEWFVEAWLRRECDQGGLKVQLRGMSTSNPKVPGDRDRPPVPKESSNQVGDTALLSETDQGTEEAV